MGLPAIPGVTTSVIDQTSSEVSLGGGRVPFIALFSKFGKGFRYCTTPAELKYYHGAIDVNRYGLGMEYAYDAFQFTNRVLTYRLVSPDAALANYCISVDNNYFDPIAYNQLIDEALPVTDSSKRIKVSTFTNINTIEEYATNIDTIDKDNTLSKKVAFSILAQAPGAGYNDLFTTFSPAIDYEKLDANREGETNYKFNFIRANIFEDSSGIVKSLSDSFVFSLIDQDETTGKVITDMYTGDELFVNQISKLKNDFLTFAIDIDSDEYTGATIREQMRKYATIDALIKAKNQAGRLILLDNGKKYEISCTSLITAQADGTTTIKYKAIRTIKPDNFPYKSSNNIDTISFEQGGVTQYAKLKWVPESDGSTNYVLGYDIVANPNVGGSTPSVVYVDGDNAYYQISINTDGVIEFSQVGFLRWYVYNYLLTHNIRLESGTDDDPTSTNPLFNSAGYLYLPSNVETCKARDIIRTFFNETAELTEVLYPKYDFDYLPDWTNNIDVINTILSFGDKIGISMPLVSLPAMNYNIGTNSNNEKAADADLELRNSLISLSTYNAMLYGSQINKLHISNATGQRLRMPMSYYAMMAHLRIDRDYSITEPVANMIKGTILGTSKKNLAYSPSSERIEKLRNVQINAVINEPDGLYIIDQLTMYKKASKLSRGNVVKVLHRMRKDLPKILKDLIQSKETANVIDVALERTYTYLSKYLVSPENYKNGIFKTINVQAVYNADTYTLRLGVTVNPIGTIEVIDIPIIVI